MDFELSEAQEQLRIAAGREPVAIATESTPFITPLLWVAAR